MPRVLKRDERAKLIEDSLKRVTIRHEQPKNRNVKISQLNDAAAKVAVEYADFETPWEQVCFYHIFYICFNQKFSR